MKAAIFKEINNPLIIEDAEIPVIFDNDLLIKVVACGVCHTDLHYIDHGVKTFKKPPIILGHEASGIVEKSNSPDFKKGDRILIPSVLTCGKCDFCLSEQENLCSDMLMPGNSINGAFAQYISVPAKDIIKLPDEIPLEEACIIADAISTPFHAVMNRAKVKKNDRVIVFGCGGVGINIVQLSAYVGAEVIACDIDDHKLSIAKDFGAQYALNPKNIDIKEFLKQNGGLTQIAFEVIGNPQTIEQAYKVLAPGGKLCIIGYTNQNININPAKIMFYEQEIIGSLGCSPKDYPKIIDLVKHQKINISKLVSNKFELDNINKALDELRNGRVLRNIILPNGKNQDELSIL